MTTGNSLEIQLAISRVAMHLQSDIYAGAKNKLFEPQRNTIVHDAWHGKKLSERHQEAWYLTIKLFRDAAGISPGNGGYGDRPAGAGADAVPSVYYNAAQQRLDRLKGRLHNHEFRLLYALTMEHFQSVKIYSLAELGKRLSGYIDTAQGRASGVTTIQRLCDSLAEFHGI